MSYTVLIWNDYSGSQNALFNDFWQFCHDKVFQPKQKYKKSISNCISFVWSCFRFASGRSGLFWLISACSGLLWYVPGSSVFTNYNLTECFNYEIYQKIQSGTSVITKWDSFNVLQKEQVLLQSVAAFLY